MWKNKSKLQFLYRQMLLIRFFEEAVQEAYQKGWMPGLAHLYIGQEAVAVGACAALRESDWITSTHRGHGHVIAKGARVDRMMAEVHGKVTGYCRGKGGSMHIVDSEVGILGANGIVGGSLGIATGAGLTAKMTGSDQVCLCFFGEGATNQGIFHEVLNMASTWQLPVIYLCENNLYALGVAYSRAVNIKHVSERGKSYEIPSKTIDGNDVHAVYECVREAVDRARAGKGPYLIECLTYRWRGHNVGDPGLSYRTQEEVEAWKEQCPIERFKAQLVEQGQLTEEHAKKIEEDVRQEIDSAVTYARESPTPEFEELDMHVYAQKLA